MVGNITIGWIPITISHGIWGVKPSHLEMANRNCAASKTFEDSVSFNPCIIRASTPRVSCWCEATCFGFWWSSNFDLLTGCEDDGFSWMLRARLKKRSAVGNSSLSSIVCTWQGRDLRPETLGHHIPANRWTNWRSCTKWSGAEVSDGLTVQLHAFDHKSGWLWPEFDLRRSRHHLGSCMEPSCRHAGSGSRASDWSRAWSEDISADHEWPHWGVGHVLFVLGRCGGLNFAVFLFSHCEICHIL